jgi:hypothetical protein
MDKSTFFLTLFVIWYFKEKGIPINLINFFFSFYYRANDFLNYCNRVLSSKYFKYGIEETVQQDIKEEVEEKKEEETKPQTKYEDKYLNEIRNLDKEYKFDEQEEVLRGLKLFDFCTSITEEFSNKIEGIRDKLGEIEAKLTKYESSDDDYCICDDEDDEDSYLGETKEERVVALLEKQKKLWNEENALKKERETNEYKENVLKTAHEMARNFVIKQRLEKLKNCYIIETTPLGNVLMVYDIERESFKYYSDNTIPYRYLEVVGRKYVKQFGCRPVFIDMEDELKLAEERWEKEIKEKEIKEEEEKKRKEEAIKNQKPVEEKKNVFAKFKSYNKESGTGHVNTAAPPKNSIPNKKLTEQQENEKVLLKERANRYTYEGKFVNFNFIKKIDRKVVDKKLAMTFADFKKSFLKK